MYCTFFVLSDFELLKMFVSQGSFNSFKDDMNLVECNTQYITLETYFYG